MKRIKGFQGTGLIQQLQQSNPHVSKALPESMTPTKTEEREEMLSKP